MTRPSLLLRHPLLELLGREADDVLVLELITNPSQGVIGGRWRTSCPPMPRKLSVFWSRSGLGGRRNPPRMAHTWHTAIEEPDSLPPPRAGRGYPYTIREYDDAAGELLEIRPPAWRGAHLPERRLG